MLEFHEVAIHHTLHARQVYPKELFEPRAFYGARAQRCRHPDLDSYVESAVRSLRAPIARGDVRRVALVLKDGDSGGAGAPLERHVFDFEIHAPVLDRRVGVERRDVDELIRAFAAVVSKISFLDACAPPIPRGALAGVTFEIVAYAGRPGVAAELGADAWSEERVGRDGGAGEATEGPARAAAAAAAATRGDDDDDGAEDGVRARRRGRGVPGEEREDEALGSERGPRAERRGGGGGVMRRAAREL